MDDDRPAAEDSLLLFPPEPDRPARSRAPSEEDALSEFLPEPETPGEEPGLPGRHGPAWLLRNGPAWCVGAAMVLCGLGVIAAVWSTRDPGLDSLRGAANQRPGGIPPSDRSSLPGLPPRSSAPARANAGPNGSPGAARPDPVVVKRDDGESSQPAAAAESARAGTRERGIEPAAPEMTPPAASALETETLAGRALAESRPADPIPAVGDPLAVAGVEAHSPSIDESGEARGDSERTRAAGPATEASGFAETDAVRRTLEAYRTAYEHLDVRAATEVWPTVDRRALTRAFSTLESQDLTLGECEIRVHEATATARCEGMVLFVPTFGSRAPVATPTGWVFRMRKSGASWTIDDVTGTEAGRN